VAFEFGSQNPGDIGNLVSAVTANDVGVVFFRGYGVENTMQSLGLVNDSYMDWQTPATIEIINDTHYITSNLGLGTHSLGYTYMGEVSLPGVNTTVLATGPEGAAIVVHNSLRVAFTPFYGHSSGYSLETAAGLEITDRTIQWAAGGTSVPDPSGLALFSIGLIGLGLGKRKKESLG
jgi:hypothetical protein